jgi:oxygen-independent coproporphyrinogen-3 oxidase
MLDAAAALRSRAPNTIETVFLGGGTPSLFSASAMSRLLDQLQPWLAADVEITMEANPGTVEHHDFLAYRQAGINRVSLGAQSFDAAQLKALGRVHGPEEVAMAFARLRDAGFTNLNLDLMYGLPGQQADNALADLEQALALEPEHLSWYQLTIEPKTEFARRPPLLPRDAEIEVMETEGRKLLDAHGFVRYEVSAYARSGRQCRHNLNYWTFGDYIGVGAGAHGKLTKDRCSQAAPSAPRRVFRTRKPAQPRLYQADPGQTHETEVREDELAVEFLMNALRLTEGVDIERFQERTGLPPERLDPVWAELADLGLMRRDRLATTELGYRHLDAVIQRFL